MEQDELEALKKEVEALRSEVKSRREQITDIKLSCHSRESEYLIE
jgi:hypothetical protein